MTVVASAASRARYWLTVSPATSKSGGRKVLRVIGVAVLPIRIRLAGDLVTFWWIGSKKCVGSRKSETR